MSDNTKAWICLAIGVLLLVGVIACFILARLGIIPAKFQMIPFVVFIVGSAVYIACMIKVIDDIDDIGEDE
ncbi:MAG: hypothetical protein ACI4MZ_03685 [Christensenellales bacterium]